MYYKQFIRFAVVTLFLSTVLEAKIIEYEASYMGIPLLDMNLTWIEDDSSVFVSYDNRLKPYIAYFHPIHNIYRVRFMQDTFYPLEWSKTVAEGDMRFSLEANRSPDGKQVTFSGGQPLPFPVNGFTVFSATHFLAAKAKTPSFFPVVLEVFIDGELWEATAKRFDASHPHPEHKLTGSQVLIQADLHYLKGTSVVQKNDILTSVIATEGTQFLLWVTPDGTYTKAQFGRFPKAVILEQKHR